MRRSSRPVLTAALLAAACSQASAVDQTPLPKATRDLLQVYPGAHIHTEQGRVRILYGTPMGGGITAQASATSWLTENGAAFGVGNLELGQEWSTPVMDGRFTVFGYKQYIDGVPVEYGIARVLVLNAGANQVVYAAGNLAPRPERGFPKVVLNGEQAQQIASGEQDAATLKTWSQPALTVFQGDGDWVTPVLTWKVSGQGALDQAKTFFVDAATGRVVYVRNDVVAADVNGTVQGWASSGLYPPDATYAAAALSLQGIPDLNVTITGGSSAFADRTGAFSVTNGGTSAVTVNAGTASPGGHWVRTVASDGAAAQNSSQSVTPPGPANFIFNATGTTNPANNGAIAPLTAQVNAAICVDVTHNYFKDRAPGFTPLDVQLPANTGVAGTCNAFFNGSSVNFYNAGGGCANTAYTTVVSHEYGHFVVQSLGLAQNAFGEGYGDVNAEMIWNDNVTGRGFLGTQSSSVRDPIAANIQYPCSTTQCSGTEIHCCGQIVAGVWWRIRTNYGTLLGEPAGLAAARNLEVAWSLITTGGESSTNSAGPGTAIAVLTVDDNDGNINNGTPHYSQICPAFAAHSISCPQIQAIAFQYPAGRPATVPPNQTSTVAVNVVGNAGTPQPGTGTVSYRIGTSGSFTTVPMAQGAPNQYTATLPAAPCPSTIQYYFSAQSTSAVTQSDPADAPASQFVTAAVSGSSTVVDLNMDTDPGWTVTNDPSLTTGAWQRGVPVTPVPTNCPPSAFGGSGQCWVTDNRADVGTSNFDVDGGPTVLTTAAYDLSAFGDADISYARWIKSVNGVLDSLTVQVSNNGSNWTTVEVVPNTAAGWVQRTFRLGSIMPVSNQVRVRFSVVDNPSDSVTEAGIDAFKIVGYSCGQPCYPNCDGSVVAPILNVADFSCFLSRYAAGDSYANCDGSTTVPVLNVADFSCFLSSYAAGCP